MLKKKSNIKLKNSSIFTKEQFNRGEEDQNYEIEVEIVQLNHGQGNQIDQIGRQA
jgi:hypothetical protein